MSIGERIREARRNAGLTQAELAEKSGIAINSLRLYEADKRNPKYEVITRIASALNISVPYLLGQAQDQAGVFPYISEDQLGILKSRLSSYLSRFDLEDIRAALGTYEPYADILDGKVRISTRDVATIGDELGLSARYLLGETDTPYPTLLDYPNADLENLGLPLIQGDEDKYWASNKDGITIRAKADTEDALTRLTNLVLAICHDENVVSETQKTRELAYIPVRINKIIAIIKQNETSIKSKLPGMLPSANMPK